ncbi:neprilysin-1-like [Dermacentor albipictus]|uniref:neprilysin-1-like n=1 Tax=Dermacentor albipictus TaxID=60249 RepID=UPI0031FD5E04
MDQEGLMDWRTPLRSPRYNSPTVGALSEYSTDVWPSEESQPTSTLTLFSLFGLLLATACGILLIISLLYNSMSYDVSSTVEEETIRHFSFPSVSYPKSSSRLATSPQANQPVQKGLTTTAVSTQPGSSESSGSSAVGGTESSVSSTVGGSTHGSETLVCNTTNCSIIAQTLQSKLDNSVDPCQDFYRYVCGTYSENNQVAQLSLKITQATLQHLNITTVPSTGQTSWEKVAGLFRACLSLAHNNRSQTSDLVEWMISLNLDLKNEAKLERVDAVDMMMRCSLDFGIQAVLSITFHSAWFIKNKRAMQLGFSEEDAAWIFSRYSVPKKKKLDDYIELLGLYGLTSPGDELLAAKIMEYEKQLERTTLKSTPREASILRVTISSMGEMTKPYVTAEKWSTVFATYTNQIYGGNDTIVYQEDVLPVLVRLIKSKAVGFTGLRYLIAWSLFRQMVQYTEPRYFAPTKSISDTCYDRVLKVMKLAAVNPYLRATVTPEMLLEAEEMLLAILTAFRTLLVSSTWLKSTARVAAMRKLFYLQYHIGGPSSRRHDAAHVEELYAPLPDVDPNRFFTSWRKALSLSRHQIWADQTSWQFDEAEVNAHYKNNLNILIIPTAILQQPLFFFESPPALNYGGIATIMAHEIMHGYDSGGTGYDRKGNFNPWATREFGKAYKRKTDCIRRSHEYVANMMHPQEKLVDTSTLENLADFVGTMTAYKAYYLLPDHKRKMRLSGLNMTAEHLFFINSCVKLCGKNPMAAGRYASSASRCIVPLMNMPEFAAAFGCAIGTPMNRQMKCTFW